MKTTHRVDNSAIKATTNAMTDMISFILLNNGAALHFRSPHL